MLEIDAAFGGLLGDSTAAHIHCCTSMAGSGTAPVMTELPSLLGFPLGEHSGAYSHVFDTSLSSSMESRLHCQPWRHHGRCGIGLRRASMRYGLFQYP
jgi:hypothetical protein